MPTQATRRSCARESPKHADRPDWSQILIDAVNKPGVISTAYTAFWNYSVGNQFLALFDCLLRRIEPGPIHTFKGWLDLGRHVKRGEKAITLCMPVTVKCRRDDSAADAENVEPQRPETTAAHGAEPIAQQSARTAFMYRPHWFVLSQTEGKEYIPAELPEWSECRALDGLEIERISFRHTDGNAQGYARDRAVAISPLAFAPSRTLMHELAHVVLGHTQELSRMDDDDSPTPRDLREVEAECVALICCSSLGLGGEEFSRGYIQQWLKGQAIPERSARRIFRAADQILRAGRLADAVA